MEISIATSVGGLVPIWLIGLLCGRLFFKDTETVKKINYSTGGSFIICSVLSGFGNMNGGGLESFSPFYMEYLLFDPYLKKRKFPHGKTHGINFMYLI